MKPQYAMILAVAIVAFMLVVLPAFTVLVGEWLAKL